MRKVFIILIGLFLFISCKKDKTSPDDPIVVDEAALTAFNASVRALPSFTNPQIIDPPEEVSSETPVESGNYLCTTKRYKAAAGFNEMLLLNSNSQELYPGALIKGETILTGEYASISGKRKPITISVSLTNLNGPVSRVVADPGNVSEVRQAIADILSPGVTGSTPAELSFSIENVYSEQQLSASIGANYSGATVDASGSFDFSSTNTDSKIIIKFVQKYFSVDMDKIENPSDLFSDTDLPELASLGSTLPNYISSVNYGRMVLFTATSSYSNIEMQAAFQASYNAAVTSGGGEVESKYQKIINNSTIKAFVLGGDGGEAVKTVNGVEGVKSFILSGGNYSKDSPGAPLSYTLKKISDGTISNVVLATEYTARQCEKVRSSFTMTLDNISSQDEGGTAQFYGYIGFMRDTEYETFLNTPIDPFNPYFPITYMWGPYNDDNYQTSTGGSLNISKSFTFVLEDIGPDSYIMLLGNLDEYDYGIGDADEHLGFKSKKVFLSELILGQTSLIFNGDGVTATANFTILPND